MQNFEYHPSHLKVTPFFTCHIAFVGFIHIPVYNRKSALSLFYCARHFKSLLKVRNSESCNIWHLWGQRVARYHNFPNIRMLYILCILWCIAILWTTSAFNFSPDILSYLPCHTISSPFTTS